MNALSQHYRSSAVYWHPSVNVVDDLSPHHTTPAISICSLRIRAEEASMKKNATKTITRA